LEFFHIRGTLFWITPIDKICSSKQKTEITKDTVGQICFTTRKIKKKGKENFDIEKQD